MLCVIDGITYISQQLFLLTTKSALKAWWHLPSLHPNIFPCLCQYTTHIPLCQIHGETGRSLEDFALSYFVTCLICLCICCPSNLNCPTYPCLSVHILFVPQECVQMPPLLRWLPQSFPPLPPHHKHLSFSCLSVALCTSTINLSMFNFVVLSDITSWSQGSHLLKVSIPKRDCWLPCLAYVRCSKTPEMNLKADREHILGSMPMRGKFWFTF